MAEVQGLDLRCNECGQLFLLEDADLEEDLEPMCPTCGSIDVEPS